MGASRGAEHLRQTLGIPLHSQDTVGIGLVCFHSAPPFLGAQFRTAVLCPSHFRPSFPPLDHKENWGNSTSRARPAFRASLTRRPLTGRAIAAAAVIANLLPAFELEPEADEVVAIPRPRRGMALATRRAEEAKSLALILSWVSGGGKRGGGRIENGCRVEFGSRAMLVKDERSKGMKVEKNTIKTDEGARVAKRWSNL